MVFDIANAFLFLSFGFTFFSSNFIVRRYDDVYLIISRPIKCYFYSEIGRKNINRFLGNAGVSEWHLNL